MQWKSLFSYSVVFGGAQALDCSPSSIQSVLSANASVNWAYPLQENSTLQVPKGDTGYPTNPIGLPALCAISIQVQSIGNTTYGFGLLLPELWNGRFLAVGNGGFGGGINWEDMGPGSRYGFATMSTDTGHNSSTGDGSWAYRQPDKIENWGHRAMHGSVVTAKLIVSAYYSKDISYNYYAGCSTGGRQGLKEAERYPEDFDGIIAGAPAWWTTHLQPWTIKVAMYNLPTTADHHIPPSKFSAIGKEVMKQCDVQDGVKDTIISDPQGCNFRPEELLCGQNVKNTSTAGCLTAPQLSTLTKIYSDSWSENQTFTFPHLYYGSEPQWALLSSDLPNPLGTDYVRYFLNFGADWSPYEYNESIQRLADAMDPGNANVKFDLSAFHARGGKILSYHGMSDGLIPTGSATYFYNQVVRELKPRGIEVDDFFRFFLVPGMGHCSGTFPTVNAPWYFAGPNQASALGPTVYSVPGFKDADHDAMLAMMRWVEEGKGPDYIIGTKYANEATQIGITRQRPLCMYPKQAKYNGSGDVSAASSWSCKSLYG
ncbi:hypothetical protein COCVIDRAFT_30823 [Bipolaris victoriae FI3]|uniref:Carboxylic ester hydrolase n=1 Tax=Bipolaris victoriae (strain FI3) TaxID=930091 RepID=W7E851_BIPV3|nr:hypothetical protein COCVIDRAFT_30823 [Bipolaris victoriae FI3]